MLHIGGHRPDSITGGDMVNFPGVLRSPSASCINFLLRYFQQQKMIARYTPDGIWEEVYQMEHPRAHFVAIPLPLHCDQK